MSVRLAVIVAALAGIATLLPEDARLVAQTSRTAAPLFLESAQAAGHATDRAGIAPERITEEVPQ